MDYELEPVGTIPEIGDFVVDIGSNWEGPPVEVVAINGLNLSYKYQDKILDGIMLNFFLEDYGELGYKNRVLKRKKINIKVRVFTAADDTWKCVYWPHKGMWHSCNTGWMWTHLDRISDLLKTYENNPAYTEHRPESSTYQEIVNSWLNS